VAGAGGRMCAWSHSAEIGARRLGTPLEATASMRTSLYEVWFSSGRGIHVGPRFKLLQDALRYVETHASEASHAVRGPDGSWKLIEPRHG